MAGPTGLAGKLISLATRTATEFKAVRTIINGNAADLSSLQTGAKSNLVVAINEVVANLTAEALARAGLLSDDEGNATSLTTTASNSKIRNLIAKATSDLVASSPGTLDTLKELADAIGDDPNFAASMSTALGNRLRLDSNQTLTSTQQLQGRQNLDVYSKADMGDPETDFVAVFNQGLS